KASTRALDAVKAVAAGSLCVVLIGAALEASLWLSEPPIIRDIVGGFFRPGLKDGREVYQQRVQTMFPTKIPEAELLTLLSRQGYEISRTSDNGQRYAKVSSSLSIVCSTAWGVTWRVDTAGLVSEVNANVYSACL